MFIEEPKKRKRRRKVRRKVKKVRSNPILLSWLLINLLKNKYYPTKKIKRLK